MRRRNRQAGSVLIMVIGITAALAIMSSGLVFIFTNVSHNTANERTRTKAFNVSEGALDYAMNTLAASWPKAGTTTPPVFALSSFQSMGQFGVASQYAAPKTGLGPFADVLFYDNTVATNQPDGINPNVHIDANGDGKMWLLSSGATGAQKATIQAEVNRQPYNTNFPRGIAAYAGGDLTSNGGGNNPKIRIEDQGSAPSVVGYVGGNLQAPSVFQSTITPTVGANVPSLESLGFGTDLVGQVVALAVSLNRYYDTTKPGVQKPTDYSGVCVIRVADNTTVSLGNNGGINSLANPGILFILGPEGGSGNNITLDMGGHQSFYGVLYTDGRFQSANGTPDVHGMVVCKSNLDMKGTPGILYNDSVIANLSDQWTLSVNLVSNTWRQTK